MLAVVAAGTPVGAGAATGAAEVEAVACAGGDPVVFWFAAMLGTNYSWEYARVLCLCMCNQKNKQQQSETSMQPKSQGRNFESEGEEMKSDQIS